MKAASLFLAVSLAASSLPCCATGPDGEPIKFRGQTNLVLFDPATKTEHFIRDARFQSAHKRFGFLAPSPSRPELAEADPALFDALEKYWPKGKSAELPASSPDAAAGGVEVVEVKKVAGFKASVLKANDTEALAGWLSARKFKMTPGVKAWLAPYVEKGWYMTAFEVDNAAQIASTGVVRMSFQTDRPFNPYSVPAENTGGESSLRLYFASVGEYEPKLAGEAWIPRMFSTELPSEDKARILKLAGVKSFEGTLRLAGYHDYQFPKPAAEDLFFVPASSAGSAPGSGGPVNPVAATVVLIAAIALWPIARRALAARR